MTKAPIMRRLVVAAGVLILLFGTYFSVNYFNDALNNGAELAIVEEEEMALDLAPLAPVVELENSELNDAENAMETAAADELKIAEVAPIVENEIDALVEIPKPSEVVSVEDGETDVMSSDMVVEDFELEEELDYFEEDLSQEGEAVQSNSLFDVGSTTPNETLKKDEKNIERIASSNKRNKRNRKMRVVAEKSVPVISVASDESPNLEDKQQNNILVIEDHKVYDYREEYEAEETKTKADDYVSESVAAGYESKAAKDLADKELQETIVEVTYQETLEKAIKLFKNESYRAALSEFDVIIAKHPEDVNAQFYMGLSCYHLGHNKNALKKLDQVLKNKQSAFNEEASWYKALTLIQMKSTTAAKKILKTIVKTDGFYKAKAEQKLEEL